MIDSALFMIKWAELLSHLLAQGGLTPLMQAVVLPADGAPRSVKVLLKHRADRSAQDERGRIALMYAAASRALSCIEALAEHTPDSKVDAAEPVWSACALRLVCCKVNARCAVCECGANCMCLVLLLRHQTCAGQ